MAGILDNKSRVLDNIITLEGRRQLSTGKLQIVYVTFSDSCAFYKADIASGSADASVRLYFEASNRHQDQVTFKADDSGKLNPFSMGSNYSLNAGQLTTPSTETVDHVFFGSATKNNSTVIIDDAFASQIDGILSSSFDHFRELYTIGTRDRTFDDVDFGVSTDSITFALTNDRPIAQNDGHSTVANLNHLESLFSDPRLSRLKNFKYLPPINRLDDVSVNKKDIETIPKENFLGDYPPLGKVITEQEVPELIKTLNAELQYYESLGYMKLIRFDPTSRANQLIGQFFEASSDTIKKLDIIDFGQHNYVDNAGQRMRQHIFFAGKLFVDDNSTHNFIHLFTLVFE